jgi:hypothetical protein
MASAACAIRSSRGAALDFKDALVETCPRGAIEADATSSADVKMRAMRFNVILRSV